MIALMHSLPYEIDCTACGCPDIEVERAPTPGEWFGSGRARCNCCGRVFAFRAPADLAANGEGDRHAGNSEGIRHSASPASSAVSDAEDDGLAGLALADRVRTGVVHVRPRCPGCDSLEVPVQRTKMPICYRRCRACGINFKTVEK